MKSLFFLQRGAVKKMCGYFSVTLMAGIKDKTVGSLIIQVFQNALLGYYWQLGIRVCNYLEL